jgi:UDP-2,3-diacylglucosamine pyrophosphatase LpxH
MGLRAGLLRFAALIFAIIALVGGLGAQESRREQRVTVFISDLHFGVGHVDTGLFDGGRYTSGKWHPYEDFRWAVEFGKFLDELKIVGKEENAPVELVVLGDMFELWQSPDAATCPIREENKDLGCDESGALQRLDRVLGAHKQEIAALRDFANTRENRLTIVPGNHDAALVFPKVRKRVVDEIGANAGKVVVLADGYWLSRDGLIWAEHGHDAKEDVNHYAKLPASCINQRKEPIDCDQPGAFLSRPWGEEFVQGYYNQHEITYPIIDNVLGEGNAVSYAISEARIIDVASALAKGVKFLLTDQSLDQFVTLLGKQGTQGKAVDTLGGKEGYRPRWDIDLVRAKADTTFLLNSFVNDRSYMVQEAKRLALEGKLDLSGSLKEFANEDFDRLCQYRYLRWRDKPEAQRSEADLCPVLEPEKFKELGAATRNLLHTNADLDKARVSSRVDIIKQKFPGLTGNFSYYIYGHTHAATTARPVSTDDSSWNPQMINTGAWQRVASARQLYKIFLDLKGDEKTAGVLRQEPEKLPPCYSYVYIGPYEKSRPEPKLLYWVLEDPKQNRWGPSIACPREYEAALP